MKNKGFLGLETVFIETTFLLYTPQLGYYISCMVVSHYLFNLGS